MGLYDEIRCDAPLPDGYPCADRWFQTKTFPHPSMQRYRITRDGRLLDSLGNDLEPEGYITFYTYEGDSVWREYRAQFQWGELREIVSVADRTDNGVRYGLASYRWFDAPTFLFGEDSD